MYRACGLTPDGIEFVVFLVVQQIPGVIFDLFRFVGCAFWFLRFDIDGIEVRRIDWLGRTLLGILPLGYGWWRWSRVVRVEATPVVSRWALTVEMITLNIYDLKQNVSDYWLWVVGIVAIFTPVGIAVVKGRCSTASVTTTSGWSLVVITHRCRWGNTSVSVAQRRWTITIGWRWDVASCQGAPSLLAQITNLSLYKQKTCNNHNKICQSENINQN